MQKANIVITHYVHTPLTFKLNIFLYSSTEILAIAQKYRVLFSVNFSMNDKADYIVTFWFGSTA